ncbi:MAG: hypothetical protein JXD23_15065 [Spirochaetales bacterium]|nr:hypothetical protein [Spirochaetales bacterium]
MRVTGNGTSFSAAKFQGNSYSLDAPLWSGSCVISGFVEYPNDSFVFCMTGVNLNGASPVSLDVIEAAAAEMRTAVLNFNAAGNTACGFYSSPAGCFPIPARYIENDGLGSTVAVSEQITADATSEEVKFANRLNWPVFWRREQNDEAFGTAHSGHTKKYVGIGGIGQNSLPSIDPSSLGPTEIAHPGTLTCVGGVLSQQAVTGADIDRYTALDEGNGTILGRIVSDGESVALPVEILQTFEGRSIRFRFVVRESDLDEFKVRNPPYYRIGAPETSYGEIAGGSVKYKKVISISVLLWPVSPGHYSTAAKRAVFLRR